MSFRQFTASFADLGGVPLTGVLSARVDAEALIVGSVYIMNPKVEFPLVAGTASGRLPVCVRIVLSLGGPYGAIWRTVVIPRGTDEIDLSKVPDRTPVLFDDAPAINADPDRIIDGGSADAQAPFPGFAVDGGYFL